MIFLEYAIDVAQACRERGHQTVAVSAGYICAAPRAEFYAHMDAANIDLKAFTEGFYKKLCSGALQPVLETLEYIRHETDVWLEITTLLIPGHNDEPPRSRRCPPGSWTISGRTCRCTSRRSIPTTRCWTWRTRRTRR